MQRLLEAGYGLARLSFGTALMTAPERLGGMFLGDGAGRPETRAALRLHGTRDTVLGLGTLRAVRAGGDIGAWLAAGIVSDALDAVVHLAEWSDHPPEKRLPNLLLSLAGAAGGVVILARQLSRPSAGAS